MDYEKVITLGIGAIIGFLLAILRDWLVEGRKQKERNKQFKREKLEEIFVLLDKVNQNALRPLQAYDDTVDTARLSMIIRFYFPQLENNFRNFVKEYTEIGRIKLDNKNHVDAYMKGLSEEYRQLCNRITDESKKL